ncbi:MAG TPA: hypothetical protein VKD65_11605 [Candidatus Angelobacter sp.]|nr:hypothetical protein [Candidatus Angelobacter sp.]
MPHNLRAAENSDTMRTTKLPGLLAILAMGFCCGVAVGQDRVFNWLPANEENVRLDPANYHTARTYHPSSPGASNHVDIRAQQPVTIFMAAEADWNAAVQNPLYFGQLRRYCVQEHVTNITYVCEMPLEPMTLVILDDRRGGSGQVAFAGVGAVLDQGATEAERRIAGGIAAVLAAKTAVPRHFVAPNDVHIQYYRWDCVEYCVQPEIAWTRQVNEKYKLSSFLKIYGGFAADHDQEPVSIKIKAPIPMLVAMVPSSVANQLHARPEMLEPALEKVICQQRGVQTMEFQCKFDVTDGPQSLIVVPEQTEKVPGKKAEIAMFAAKCVANCELLQSTNQPN